MLRRSLLRALAALGLLGPAGVAGLVRHALAAGNKPVPPGMYRVRGTVTINGQPARAGQPVQPGDTVATGRGSEAIYVIGQNAYLQREESTVSFAASQAAQVMRVVTGKILSVFGKGEHRLETPTATIGIRGTACYIEAAPKTVYFCLCYGTAEVRPTADPERVERITTRHHDHPIYIHHDSAMPAMVPAGVFNHGDDELVLLENLTGRWPPFGSKGAYY